MARHLACALVLAACSGARNPAAPDPGPPLKRAGQDLPIQNITSSTTTRLQFGANWYP